VTLSNDERFEREGTVVRVASNHGVKNSTLRGLRDLVAILNGVASRGE
jgi:hypothetical protein